MQAIFTAAEMARRLGGFRADMRARGIDAALLHTADSVFYLTGVPLLSEWGRPLWAVVFADGPVALCGAAIERETMAANGVDAAVLTYGDDSNTQRACLERCLQFIGQQNSGPLRLGLEEARLPVGVHRRLTAACERHDLVEVADIVDALRLVKSPEELDLLALGADVAKIGADAFLDALHWNATELAVASRAMAAMNRALGALGHNVATSTYAYAQFGEHTLTPHLHPTDRRLERGDLVALNVFPVIWGYCMELERTFVFGEPSEDQGRALDAVNRAFDAGKEAVRPGVVMGEIDALTRRMLCDDGFGEYIRHGTGHAHGIMIGSAGREEGGELRVYNRNVLQPNMVNSIEPGVYVPGLGGFRHSDVMLVTAEGARCLTDFPRDL